MLPRDVSNKFLKERDYDSLPMEPKQIDPKVDWASHLEMLPLATWICSADGSRVYLNLSCRRLLGLVRLNDVLNNKWTGFIHQDDRKAYLLAWNRFIGSSAARFKFQARWIRPDTGRLLTLRVRVQKLHNGNFQGWVSEATAELALSKLEEMGK